MLLVKQSQQQVVAWGSARHHHELLLLHTCRRHAARAAAAAMAAASAPSRRSGGAGSSEREQVVVVGGGAAGLTAAYFAACAGARVTLLERMSEAGKKILMSGGTRWCVAQLQGAGGQAHKGLAALCLLAGLPVLVQACGGCLLVHTQHAVHAAQWRHQPSAGTSPGSMLLPASSHAPLLPVPTLPRPQPPPLLPFTLPNTHSNVLPLAADPAADYFTESSPSALRALFASWTLEECRQWCVGQGQVVGREVVSV